MMRGLVLLTGASVALHSPLRVFCPRRQGHQATTTMRSDGLEVRTKLVFVGGKGGVGKTSTAAALGVKYAATERVLLVSTDPAHSLCDALEVRASATPVRAYDDLELYAMEVDADGAMEKWRSALDALDVDVIAERYGKLGAEALRSLGLEELKELASAPPPGVDEVVALARVFQYRDDYDRVVVDTAPTGHALRLLELPTFAESFLSKLSKLKDAARKLADLAGGFLGGVETVAGDLERALDKIEDLRVGVATVRDALRNKNECEFVAVAVPTTLSFLETERLVAALEKAGVACNSLVVNRVLSPERGFDEDRARSLARQQRSCLTRLRKNTDLPVVEVPFVDSAELVGPDALRGLAAVAPDLASSFFHDDDDDDSETTTTTGFTKKKSKLIVVGGKGGVGKSTTAATVAVASADRGLRTCAVSTDPAHSLGDALGVSFEKGRRHQLEANLELLEIDADAAAQEASELLRDAVLTKLGATENSRGLAQLAEALETPPPGVDELVALLKVLTLLRDPDLDVVVLDTAPTGHTLRMLALPEILDDFADRAVAARTKLKNNPLVRGALSAAGVSLGNGNDLDDLDDDLDDDDDRLRDLQDRAFALDVVLHDPGRTSFVLVAAPTDLSVTETQRLDDELKRQDIPRAKLVVNGLIDDTDDALRNFADHLQKTQNSALTRLQALADDNHLAFTQVQQFDTDLTGRYGLMALAMALFHKEEGK